jgi:hypothetical protein
LQWKNQVLHLVCAPHFSLCASSASGQWVSWLSDFRCDLVSSQVASPNHCFTCTKFLCPGLYSTSVFSSQGLLSARRCVLPAQAPVKFPFFCEPRCHWPDLVLWFPFCVNDFGVPLMSFWSMLASCPTAGANRHRASLYIVRSFTARPSRLFLFWPFYNYYSKNELGETFFFEIWPF